MRRIYLYVAAAAAITAVAAVAIIFFTKTLEGAEGQTYSVRQELEALCKSAVPLLQVADKVLGKQAPPPPHDDIMQAITTFVEGVKKMCTKLGVSLTPPPPAPAPAPTEAPI